MDNCPSMMIAFHGQLPFNDDCLSIVVATETGTHPFYQNNHAIVSGLTFSIERDRMTSDTMMYKQQNDSFSMMLKHFSLIEHIIFNKVHGGAA
jgi:hypothetical protein